MLPVEPALPSVWQPAQPAAVKICSPVVARQAGLRQRAAVLAGLAGGIGHVGGHVVRIGARDEVGRHRLPRRALAIWPWTTPLMLSLSMPT